MAKKVTLADVAEALGHVIDQVGWIKKAVEDLADGLDSEYTEGAVTLGIKSGECPPRPTPGR